MERYERSILGRGREGVRKSCAHTIGVGRWTERYMDDVHVAVQACQEPVKSNGVWPEQADLQAIRGRRATLTRFVSVLLRQQHGGYQRTVLSKIVTWQFANLKGNCVSNLAYFPYFFRTRGLQVIISGWSVLLVSLNSLPSDGISCILPLP